LVEEAESPSGRWVVVSAPTDELDEARQRRLLLLNRKTGQLFPVRLGDWPSPVLPSQLEDAEELRGKTILVGSEEPAWWTAGNRLRVGDLLVSPGRTTLELKGDLAR
jgi:hypothetical protein